jgi:hypothetical protein
LDTSVYKPFEKRALFTPLSLADKIAGQKNKGSSEKKMGIAIHGILSENGYPGKQLMN